MANGKQYGNENEGTPSDNSFRPVRVFVNSWHGLVETFKSDFAVRYKLIALPFFLIFFCWLDVTALEKTVLVMTAFSVLIAELVNSAIESTLDRVSQNYHHLAKKAKDIGSAVVLLTFLCAFIVWVLILGGRYL